MRIVIWTDAFSPEIGGLEVFCLRMMEGWKARGHRCLVIANCDSKRAPRHETMEGVEVHRFAFHEALNRADLKGFRILSEDCERAVASFQPDLIHLNICSKGLLSFALLQRAQRRPVVMTLHDRHIYRESAALTREVFAYTDAIVSVSDFIRRDVLAAYPDLHPRITSIPNCLPDPRLPAAFFPEDFRFLTVGRLIHDKGFDLAIEAFHLIASDFPRCRLTLVGDGRERTELEALVRARKLGDRVDFLGRRHPDEIPAIINNHSAILMPSRWQEPFGLVAVEAAQMGRPICAARSGGLPEIVVEGETGFLFEIEDVAGMAQTMRNLLDDPNRARQMGQRARERILRTFDFSEFLHRYEMLFREVVTNNNMQTPASRV